MKSQNEDQPEVTEENQPYSESFAKFKVKMNLFKWLIGTVGLTLKKPLNSTKRLPKNGS